MEIEERERRKRNIIIKGVEVREGKREKAVEKIMRAIGVKVKVEEVRKIARDRNKVGELVMV